MTFERFEELKNEVKGVVREIEPSGLIGSREVCMALAMALDAMNIARVSEWPTEPKRSTGDE